MKQTIVIVFIFLILYGVVCTSTSNPKRLMVDNFSSNITLELDSIRIANGYLDMSFKDRLLYARLFFSPTRHTITSYSNRTKAAEIIHRFFGGEMADGILNLYVTRNPVTSIVTVYTMLNGGECTIWTHFRDSDLSKEFQVPSNAKSVEPMVIYNGIHASYWQFQWKFSSFPTTMLFHLWKSIFDDTLVALKIENTPIGTIEIDTYNVNKRKQQQTSLKRFEQMKPQRCRLQA